MLTNAVTKQMIGMITTVNDAVHLLLMWGSSTCEEITEGAASIERVIHFHGQQSQGPTVQAPLRPAHCLGTPTHSGQDELAMTRR